MLLFKNLRPSRVSISFSIYLTPPTSLLRNCFWHPESPTIEYLSANSNEQTKELRAWRVQDVFPATVVDSCDPLVCEYSESMCWASGTLGHSVSTPCWRTISSSSSEAGCLSWCNLSLQPPLACPVLSTQYEVFLLDFFFSRFKKELLFLFGSSLMIWVLEVVLGAVLPPRGGSQLLWERVGKPTRQMQRRRFGSFRFLLLVLLGKHRNDWPPYIWAVQGPLGSRNWFPQMIYCSVTCICQTFVQSPYLGALEVLYG